MSERRLVQDSADNTAIKTSILNGEEYSFAHLVKFEKPRSSSSIGEISGKASDYAYITDASYNIEWDDGSYDNATPPSANGSQTYVANKLLNVGTINETTEARASNISVVFSGTALGTVLTANVTFTSSSLTADVDLFDLGFQEGDKILLESTGNANDGKYITVTGFTNSNRTISFTSEQNITTVGTEEEYNLSLASEELTALISSKSSQAYANYINREVLIYRAHISPTTGEIIGAPFLIFRGIIAKGSVQEDVNKDSKVSWNLTSHWGDFVRIQGRLTSDPYHRALSITGEPDTGALIRPDYATDYGFMHAEKAINITGIYQAMETRYKMKKRGGLAGLLGGKKLVEYEVEVDREVDLQFNLGARMLPVVYGVQKVDSIPIFADTLTSDPSKVWIAYAVCEGEIGGVYDIHIDESTTVCIDKADADVRDTSSAEIDVVCGGRADRGDVLSSVNTYYDPGQIIVLPSEAGGGTVSIKMWNTAILGSLNVGIGNNTSGGQGLQHESSYSFTTPINADLYIHTGKSDQLANQKLAELATKNQFKIQNDYYDGTLPYWSNSHRLLDTAYVVGNFTISEGEVTIPKYEFVVKGKLINCYNYDGSYVPVSTAAAANNFNLGDTVSIYSETDTLIQSNVRIIDKWSFYGEGGTLQYRFRFDEELDLNGNTAFYMKNASNDTFSFVAWGHEEQSAESFAGSVPTATVLTGNYVGETNTLTVVLNSPSSEFENILAALGDSAKVTFESTRFGVTNTNYSLFQLHSYSAATNTLTFRFAYYSYQQVMAAINDSNTTLTVKLPNVVKLSSNASSIDNYYNNKTLKLTKYVNDIPYSKEAVVSDYDGGLKVAALTSALETDFTPDSSYFYSIAVKEDLRASTNPAMQLLDYLTNTRYGKGLSLEKDIDLDTFIAAAKACDTQSDVTVIVPNSQTISVGNVCRYTASGRLIFEGTVASVESVSVDSTTYKQVTFTNVIGKLGYKWNNWRNFAAGDIIWNNGSVYIASSSGTLYTPPTSGALTSLELTNVTTSSQLSLSITDGYTSSGNPIVKKYTNSLEGFNSPGYSLYDSDDVKYWKYVGWDEQEQRYVTRHQLNQVINTSSPIFDNINSMLLQFNGIMRYANGKYQLDIKTAAPSSYASYETIQEEDIIGSIKVDDKGQKNSYNSMSANIIDPANKYAARAITFFNSDYLKEDKGIRRQGNFAMPGVSNYFNARLNIKQYLDESRYGLTVSFTIDAKGYLLLTGSIIRLNYSRFGWSNKLFRIESLNFTNRGLVEVIAEEHNDSAYLIGETNASGSSIEIVSGGSPSAPLLTVQPPAADSLEATSDGLGGIVLTWTNSPQYSKSTHTIEIYRSIDTSFENAELIGLTQGSRYVDSIIDSTAKSYYYWIRYFVPSASKTAKTINSTYEPANTAEGVQGTFFLSAEVSVKLQASDYSIVYDGSGENPQYTNNGTEGEIGLTTTFTGGITPLYRFTIAGTAGSWQESSTYAYTVPSYSQGADVIIVDIALKPEGWTAPGASDPAEEDILANDSISIIRVKGGAGSISVVLSNEAHSVPSETDGSNPVMTGSGTTIEVFEGATVLTPITSGTPGAGEYTVTTSVISGTITPNSNPSSASGLITFGDHSLFTTNTAVIKYTIEGLRTDGVSEFSLEKVQSLSKALQGPQGTVGPKGSIGPQGTQGPKGTQGTQGPKGSIGPQGTVGPKGEPGGAGDKGEKGSQGPKGPQGTKGAKGIAGTQGDKGPKGPVGTIGQKGIAGTQGSQGPKGPQGTVGAKGIAGTQGSQGPKGPQGTVGAKGIAGTQGSQGPKGPVGTQGAKGIAGTQGPKGDKGPQGTQGAKGIAGTQGPKGSAGPQGTVGEKGITGTAGPKGPQGTAGDKGAKGIAGTQGAKGIAGTQGAKGAKGPIGTQGAKGPAGTTGDPGPKGPAGTTPGPKGPAGTQGSPGPKGPAGTTPGPKGPQGTQGDPGPKGSAGPKGPQGTAGVKGAKGPAGTQGAKGITGTQGSQGPKGPQGTAGAKGIAGTRGSQGPKGPQGTAGAKGIAGTQGAKGAKGPTGTQGAKGIAGTQGSQGPKGPQGTAGPKGIAGTQGAKGAKGPTGTQGAKGIAGTQGAKGAKGPTGTQGAKGIAGTQGAKGAKGPTGTQGAKGIAGTQGAKGPKGPIGTAGAKGIAGTQGDQGIKGSQGSPGADAPYVVIGFNTAVDTNAERIAAIKSFSGLTTVLNNSVYWDAVTGKVYQNQGASSATPTLTELTGSSGLISADSIKIPGGTSRMEITSGNIKIYDSNTLRVKIGNLA